MFQSRVPKQIHWWQGRRLQWCVFRVSKTLLASCCRHGLRLLFGCKHTLVCLQWSDGQHTSAAFDCILEKAACWVLCVFWANPLLPQLRRPTQWKRETRQGQVLCFLLLLLLLLLLLKARSLDWFQIKLSPSSHRSYAILWYTCLGRPVDSTKRQNWPTCDCGLCDLTQPYSRRSFAFSWGSRAWTRQTHGNGEMKMWKRMHQDSWCWYIRNNI